MKMTHISKTLLSIVCNIGEMSACSDDYNKYDDCPTCNVVADMPNDRVVLFFELHGLKLMRMFTDRGTEYCGNRENHEYELYLAVENIDHSKIKAKSPQTNGICRDSTEPCGMSSTPSRSGRKSTPLSGSYKLTLMRGWTLQHEKNTFQKVPFRGNICQNKS